MEVWVHLDQVDGEVERGLWDRFPQVRVLASPDRIGPGAGRHRCLLACSAPYAASFDDDSFPMDRDFFGEVARLFAAHPEVAVFGAAIWHREEREIQRGQLVVPAHDFVGCGHAVRVEAYRSVRGYLARPVAYGMEERDLALQFLVTSWEIRQASSLRVFHDTDRSHHDSAEITAGTISNAALLAFLHYPAIAWGWGALQMANAVRFAVARRRFRGILSGLARAPIDCYRHREYRRPVPLSKLALLRRRGPRRV